MKKWMWPLQIAGAVIAVIGVAVYLTLTNGWKENKND